MLVTVSAPHACLLNGHGLEKPASMRVFHVLDGSLTFRAGKPPLLNHPKHIAHVLEQYPGDVGDGVDVVFGVVGEVGAAHELQVGEDGVEAFADAVVEFAQRGVAVDDQDGVIGCELSHRDEAAWWIIHCHISSLIKGYVATFPLRFGWVAAMCGSQTG